MLLENIYKLMDFDKETDVQFVIEEFKGKYINSNIIINDKIEYIVKITPDILITENNTFDIRKPATIKHLYLKPGLYTNEKQTGLIYIFKHPARQYCKGVKFGVTHDIAILAGSSPQLHEMKYLGISTIFKEYAYIYYSKIGEIKEANLIVYNNNLKKECEELWPQYKII